MTLHDAIAKVLADHESRSPSEIALEINRRELYTRKDGEPVPGNQISARVNKYLNLFVVTGGKVPLR